MAVICHSSRAGPKPQRAHTTTSTTVAETSLCYHSIHCKDNCICHGYPLCGQELWTVDSKAASS